tara:strand:+ start:783 stop:923 length:141 start_codon:yes stop_codon:yes gene_type:complete
MTVKRNEVEKMQAYLLTKKPVAIDKKVAYGPKLTKGKTNDRKSKKK